MDVSLQRVNGDRNFRSSYSKMFFKLGVLKNFCNIHRKTPVLEYLVNIKCRPTTLIKRDTNTGVFL